MHAMARVLSVPLLEKKPLKASRSRFGDFLAVLLLLAILAGLGWLWLQQKHPKHKAHKISSVNSLAVATSPLPVEKLKPKPIIIAPQTAAEFPRPVRDVFEAQIALVRRGISPGSLDAAIGSQTRAAIAAFQRSQKLFESSTLDTNTRAMLLLDAPMLTEYVVTTNDLARLQPIGKTWLEKSQQSALDYETILELVAEQAHSHPLLVQKLNPSVIWTNVAAGTVLKIPDVNYPEPADKAAFVVIHLAQKFLEAFDVQTNLLLHCPCSIAAKVEKRPVGELHVAVVAPDPNYTFDPAVFPESPEAQAIGHKLILPPGPNNPVGLAWIGLDKPGYGMHGTPVPEQVGRTESHGCFRLANWDAQFLVNVVWVGMPVTVVP
jgi:lipoprotein-anchoring transpeptidase ErfK/SrfK